MLTILDAHGVNPSEMSWQSIAALTEFKVYENTNPEDIVNRCRGSQLILTNKAVLTADIMDQLPELKYIGVLATGYDVIDVDAATQRGIIVTNIPSYSTESVVQMAWSHILNILNHTDYYAQVNRKGKWTLSKNFCYIDFPHHEMAGLTIGIVGLGHIGIRMVHVALAFGMKVLAVTSKPQESLPNGVLKVELNELLSHSDIISLHCPLNANTKHMINYTSLRLMKSSAILINTGRGELVNEQELADALSDGIISAYGADVLTVEPASTNCPLLPLPNCYLTPHIAWATIEARQRVIDIGTENIRAFLNGTPINVVNKKS